MVVGQEYKHGLCPSVADWFRPNLSQCADLYFGFARFRPARPSIRIAKFVLRFLSTFTPSLGAASVFLSHCSNKLGMKAFRMIMPSSLCWSEIEARVSLRKATGTMTRCDENSHSNQEPNRLLEFTVLGAPIVRWILMTSRKNSAMRGILHPLLQTILVRFVRQ